MDLILGIDLACRAAHQASLARADGTGVGAFKIAMSLLGVIDGPTQPRPLADFTDDDIAAVRDVLMSTGLLS